MSVEQYLTAKQKKKTEFAKTFLMLEKAARSLDHLIKENALLAESNRKLRQDVKDALNLAAARERVLQSFYNEYAAKEEKKNKAS